MSEAKKPDFDGGIAVESLPQGQMVAGCWRGKPILLVNENGQFLATEGTCTHMGAPLDEGILTRGEIRCPWHHARFSLATGEAIGAPAFKPLARFGTFVRDGRVFISPKPPEVAGRQSATPIGRVVVVGAGAGGYACAQWLARRGFGDRVTVLSDDADPPYDRTYCSKQYLIGMKSRQESLLADAMAGEPDLAGVVVRPGCKVQRIDAQRNFLVLEGGEQVSFGVLVLAMGAEPKRPDWPGADLPNVHVLRTLRDADALIKASVHAKRVAVVGASFIGLEAAASLRQRKLDVQVIARDDVPLKKLLGADVGKMIQTVHEEKGIRFHLGREARQFDGRRLTLDDESTVEAEFVVLGIGVTPRTALAQTAGIVCASAEEGGGVVVNDRLMTSVDGIYAIGDIALYPDLLTGENIRIEHWVHAQRQGQHVARMILNQDGRYADIPFFWSAHFDTGLLYLGHVRSVVHSSVEGSVDERNFCRDYQGPKKQKAFLSCNRDRDSLLREAAWDVAINKS